MRENDYRFKSNNIRNYNIFLLKIYFNQAQDSLKNYYTCIKVYVFISHILTVWIKLKHTFDLKLFKIFHTIKFKLCSSFSHHFLIKI